MTLELSWKPKLFNGEKEFCPSEIPDDEWRQFDVGYTENIFNKLGGCNPYVWAQGATAAWGTDDEKKVLRQHEITDYTLLEMKVLKYEEGSFLDEHVDRTRFKKHAGTLLLIGYSPEAEGGDLVVDYKLVVRKTSSEEQWFMTYIPLGTPHFVTTLLKGQRYVIKFAVQDEDT